MPLKAGQKLGPYEIVSSIGKGGMGEVYRARDTKLGRDVAIKVLPEEFASDDERSARFEREAKLLASLNHPSIASIYGFEESDGIKALVLELVEGPTLAERIEQGPVPIAEAIAIARQIADALEAGHEAGVIHRDLKPANIKIKEDGTVKVLDYGLAKALEGDTPARDESELSQSPTLTRQGTQIGVILGTAAYMSPEQAQGKSVNRQTDVWAFGAVVYEMLSGKRLFDGETVSDVLAAVLRSEIDWTHLPRTTPAAARRVLERCLTRDRKQRLHDIADARIELGDTNEPTSTVVSFHGRSRILILAAASFLVGGAVVWWLKPTGPIETRHPSRFSLPVPAPLPPNTYGGSWLALSPDGTRLVVATDDSIYLREMGDFHFERVDGTDAARGPFFSPDGKWVAFFAEGKLKKVSLETGAILDLADALEGRGGAWRDDGTIFFAPDSRSGILRVQDGAVGVKELTRPDDQRNERSHRWPSLLPGNEHILMTVQASEGEELVARVAVLSLITGEWYYIVEDGFDGRYLPSGDIVYARTEGSLLKARFDLDTMQVGAPATPILPDLTFTPGADYIQVPYDFSRNALAYVPMGSETRRLIRIDLDGTRSAVTNESLRYRRPFFSPDGRRAFIDGQDVGRNDTLWVADLDRKLVSRMASIRGYDPTWSADGQRLAVVTIEGGIWTVTVHNEANRTSEILTTHNENIYLGCWLGKSLVYLKRDRDIWRIVSKSVGGEEEVLLGDPYRHGPPELSPDKRFLAYQSNETGRDEIFVRSFPELDGKLQISPYGGRGPVWSPDGSTLYYFHDGKMMAANLRLRRDTEIEVLGTQVLFDVPDVSSFTFVRPYDISPEGSYFLFVVNDDAGASEIRFVLDGPEASPSAK